MRINRGILKTLYNVVNSVGAITILLLIIKVLGFVKVRIIAELFGVSRELDIFWAAFTIPDTIFNVLVAGAINAAIIPVFTNLLHTDESKLKDVFKRLTLVYTLFFIVISVSLFAFSNQVGELLISSDSLHKFLGTSDGISLENVRLFSNLMRIMLISPILLGASSLISAYLQAHRRFFTATLAPLLYNLGMIIGSLILVKFSKLGIYGIAWSVVIASAFHLVIQIPEFARIYKSVPEKWTAKFAKFVSHLFSKEILVVFKLALPRIIGLLGEQVNVIVNTIISFTLSAGALSAYKFALSLHLFPVQIFTGAISQVVLPKLSEEHAKGQKKAFMRTFNGALKQTLFVILPISAMILVLRLPLVRLAYGVGAFDWWATIITSWCLALLAISIVAQSVVAIILRAFYAIHETRLPLIATFVSIVVNILCGYYLTNFFSHYWDWRPILAQIVSQLTYIDGKTLMQVLWSFLQDTFRWMQTRNLSDASVGGLGLALSLSFAAEMFVAGWLLQKKIKVFSWKYTYRPVFKMLLNTVLMTVTMYYVFKLTDFSLDTTRTLSIIGVTLITSVYGGLVYVVGAKVLKISELDIITQKFITIAAPMISTIKSVFRMGRDESKK
ncbi:MAG: putative membrane protein [candidate division WS6 bacterium GW2011_GWF2_39_15]|uniref:Putative membrane protein n=1 Tax=candidate division WS6 bacterium GW2011_GWF2_39_15 TaxID=1619100 RepID=A0A0G0QV75_9BACT|nr:MAG: putative membrane protein [candidate division WS6 bacterium GW2011_GWF2_39_15]